MPQQTLLAEVPERSHLRQSQVPAIEKRALCVVTGSDIRCRVTSAHARDNVAAQGRIDSAKCSNVTSARSSLALKTCQDDSAAANQQAVPIQPTCTSKGIRPVNRDGSASIQALGRPVTPMHGKESHPAVDKQAQSVEHPGGGTSGCSVAGAICSPAASPTCEENPLGEVKQALLARRADSRTRGVARERSMQGEDSHDTPATEAPFLERIRSGTRYSSATSERCSPANGSSIEDAAVSADKKASSTPSTSSVQATSTIVRGAGASHEHCGKTASLCTDDVQMAGGKLTSRIADSGKGSHACLASGASSSPAASLSQEDPRRAVDQASFAEPGGGSSRACSCAVIQTLGRPVTPMHGKESHPAVDKQAQSVEHPGGGTSGCSVAGAICSPAASPTCEENPLGEVKQALLARRADSRTRGVARERSMQGEDSHDTPATEAPFLERIRSGTRYSSATSERCSPANGSSIEDAAVSADKKASSTPSTSSVQATSTIVRGAGASHEHCGKTASLCTDDVQMAGGKLTSRIADSGKGSHACLASGASSSPAASLSQEDPRRAVDQASFAEPGGGSSRACSCAVIQTLGRPVTPMHGEESHPAVDKQAQSVEHPGGGTSGCSVAGEVCGRNATSMQEDGTATLDTTTMLIPQVRNSARGGCSQLFVNGEEQAGNAASSADKVRSPSQADRVQGPLGPPSVKSAGRAQVVSKSSAPSGQDCNCWGCSFAGEIVVNTLPPKDRSFRNTVWILNFLNRPKCKHASMHQDAVRSMSTEGKPTCEDPPAASPRKSSWVDLIKPFGGSVTRTT